VYKALNDEEGVPKLLGLGVDGNHNFMVMDLMGPSLESLFGYCKRKFTIKTTIMVGIQMIDRLEMMHSNNYIHRDIKPDNFLVGHHKND